MRRTFGADRLYKAVFSEYVKTVLCSNDAPLEFFLEGTRSRTAKTLHPKLGMDKTLITPNTSLRSFRTWLLNPFIHPIELALEIAVSRPYKIT